MRALLQSRLVFNPKERDGERFHAFEDAGTVIPGRLDGTAKGMGVADGNYPLGATFIVEERAAA